MYDTDTPQVMYHHSSLGRNANNNTIVQEIHLANGNKVELLLKDSLNLGNLWTKSKEFWFQLVHFNFLPLKKKKNLCIASNKFGLKVSVIERFHCNIVALTILSMSLLF